MKFKKYALIVFVSHFSVMSYGQTKKETLNWLKENLKKYVVTADQYSNVSAVKVDECFIIIGYTNENGLEFETALHTKGLSVYKDGFTQTGPALALVNKENKYFDPDEKTVYVREAEPGFLKKVQKYINHLASFCSKN